MIRQIAHTFLFIILYSSTIYSQGWFWQNPLPQGTILNSVEFISSTVGWAVGEAGTILKTTNGGTTWILQTSGTTNYLYGVSVTNANNGTAVGSDGTILRTTNGGVTFIEDENNFTKPKDILLSQNYSNPFNPSTNIQYAVSSLPTGQAGRQFVSLRIFDVLGKEIATLVNEEKPAGSYEVEFDASKFTSGVYFYRLQVGGYVESKKMILLR